VTTSRPRVQRAHRFNRRHFLQSMAVWPAASIGASSIEPIRRIADSRVKLSLAAYSFREELTGRDRAMDLMQFVDLAATTISMRSNPPRTISRTRLPLSTAGVCAGMRSFRALRFPAPRFETRSPPRQGNSIASWRTCVRGSITPSILARSDGDLRRRSAGRRDDGAGATLVHRCIRQSLEYAASRGIVLALENHSGVVSTADQLLAIVHEIDSDWFGVNWDSGNFRGADPYVELALIAPYAVTVQLKTEISPNGGPPVEADLSRVVGILRNAGYRGYLALEYEAKEDRRTAVPRYLRQLRALIR